LGKQANKDKHRIIEGINGLRLSPPTGDLKKIAGSTMLRLKIGSFRILFTINKMTETIYIEAIGNRGDIYK